MRTGMFVRSPYPTVRSSMRRSGSISGGAFNWWSLARATSTPSDALNVIGNASTRAFSVGSICGRVVVGSVMHLPYVQRLAQRGQPAVHRLGRRGDHSRIAQVPVDHRLGVVHLDGNARGGEQLTVALPVVAQ